MWAHTGRTGRFAPPGHALEVVPHTAANSMAFGSLPGRIPAARTGPDWQIPALWVHAQASVRLSISLTIQVTVLFPIRLEPDTEPDTHLIENTQVTPISSASCGFATGLCRPSSGRARPVAVA